jgi:hypothetical protein
VQTVIGKICETLRKRENFSKHNEILFFVGEEKTFGEALKWKKEKFCAIFGCFEEHFLMS